MEPTEMQQLIFAIGNTNRLAILALFDAVAEMLGPDADEFRMRFIRQLDGRAQIDGPEKRLLLDLVATVRAERAADTTPGTHRSKLS